MIKKIILAAILFSVSLLLTKTYAQDKDVNISLKSSELTFGTAKKHIKPGVTKQEEIVSIFGSADNLVMRDGKETWIYDRLQVETSTSSEGNFINLLIVGANNRTSNVTTRTKNLTLIIKFDAKGIVEDFNVRSGGY
jgi:hypothetical protein